MVDAKETIEQFFDSYAERINDAVGDSPVVDVNAVAHQFAEIFVEASPSGVTGDRNDDSFRARIPRMYEFYRERGMKSRKITKRKITQLDDEHWMVKISWQTEYLTRTEERDEIEFDITYFVQLREGHDPKIFAYITGEERRILRERGLIQKDVSAAVIG